MENKVSTAATQIAIVELYSAAKWGSGDIDQAYQKAMAMIKQLESDLQFQRNAAFKLANML